MWHLQGNFNDSSSNGYDLTESVSAPTDIDGKIGRAKSFDKASSQQGYIASASCSNLSITGDMTFTGWLNPTTTSTYMMLGGKRGEGSGTYPGYSLCTDTQRRLFWTHNNTQSAITTGTMTTGNNYYCVGVSDITNSKVKCSLNASAFVEAAGSTGTANSVPFAIGCDYQLVGEAAGYFFNGMLDEIRMANVARTYDWIATEYANQNAPATFVIEGTEEDVGNTSVTITPDALALTSVINDGTISTVRNITTILSVQSLTASQPEFTVTLPKNITVVTTVQSLTSSQPNITVYPLAETTTASSVIYMANRDRIAIKLNDSGTVYLELD